MRHAAVTLPVVLGLFFLTGASNAGADHGGGTGGGCSGDCTPPTIGTDNAGRQIVAGGFAINGNAFDVKHFKQDIPTQLIKVNEPVTVTLTVFENTVPQSLKHVGLMLGLESKFVAGVTVPTHLVEIHWERDPGGEPTVQTDDPGGLVKDVSVTEVIEERNNVVTFEFTPTQAFDTGTVLVQTWDTDRNLWTNYFYDSMQIVVPSAETGAPAGTIPEWVKNNAGWWADGQIGDGEFVQAIQYLIEEGIIAIPPTAQEPGPGSAGTVPEWVKNNAGWWADGQIGDGEFVQAIQYLVTAGIITA